MAVDAWWAGLSVSTDLLGFSYKPDRMVQKHPVSGSTVGRNTLITMVCGDSHTGLSWPDRKATVARITTLQSWWAQKHFRTWHAKPWSGWASTAWIRGPSFPCGGSVMVLGMFSWHTLSTLIPNEHRLIPTAYLSIDDRYLKHDNAPQSSLKLVLWTWQWVHLTKNRGCSKFKGWH